jgi:shikimate kinase
LAGEIMRIYLIGLPGCGKSTLGKKLAQKINYKFIDMDQDIEIKACMFIDEIFELYGEPYFRALEKNTLKEYQELDNVIISTGGGIVNDLSNKKLFNGTCIYLKADLESVKKRLEESNVVRPLLQKMSLEEIYHMRKDKYNYFKDIEVENEDIDFAIETIIKELAL